jgi:hypothetical protein
LSYIAFIVNKGVKVVAPTNGSTYNGSFRSYKVSVPVSKSLNGVKFETIGEGIKFSNQCEVFIFTLGGDQTKSPITVQTKAGTKVSSVIVDPATCVCVQNAVATATARQGYKPESEGTEQNIKMTAFPNPAYGEANIEFTVPQTGQTALSVYNTRGDKVKTLFEGIAEGGKTYRVTLKTDDRIVPGAYIYRVQSGTASKSSRLIMLKQ